MKIFIITLILSFFKISSSIPTYFPTLATNQPTSNFLPISKRPTASPTLVPTLTPPPFTTNAPTSLDLPVLAPNLVPTDMTADIPSLPPTSAPTFNSIPVLTVPVAYEYTFIPTREPTTASIILPSSHPTFGPVPTFMPTAALTNYPTFTPTIAPAPVPNPYTTTISGTVDYKPTDFSFCSLLEFDIDFVVDSQILPTNAYLFFKTPGLTSGSCINPVNGNDVNLITISSHTGFILTFIEGSYLNGFQDSYISIRTIYDRNPDSTVHYSFKILSSNGLREACTTDTQWDVFMDMTSVISPHNVGAITKSHIPKPGCFDYSSTLTFYENRDLMHPTSFNFSLVLASPVMNNIQISLNLPGFTMGHGYLKLNPAIECSVENTVCDQPSTEVDLDVILTGSGSGTSNNFLTTMKVQWVEADSKLIIYPDNVSKQMTNGEKLRELFISVSKLQNLHPTRSFLFNDTALTYSVESDEILISDSYIKNSNSLGYACSSFNNCNYQGDCDTSKSICKCYDGFGSDKDKLYAVSNDFAIDCSSLACPLGQAFSAFPLDTSTDATVNHDMHRMLECSGIGTCNRANGKCECPPGFTGGACEKMECINQCSNRGVCTSINRLSRLVSIENSLQPTKDNLAFLNKHYGTSALPLQTLSYRYNNNVGVMGLSKVNWDSDFGSTCVCDSSWLVGLGENQVQLGEYFGTYCQYRRCPSGDDPSTPENELDCHNKSQTSGTGIGSVGNLCHIDCSNQGTCDYTTGTCKCYPGYAGAACNILSK